MSRQQPYFRKGFSGGLAVSVHVICLVLVACSGDKGEGSDSAEGPKAIQSFDVGGYEMSIECQGEVEGPVVILDAGSYGDTTDWATDLPLVADFARVCAFDRPNLGRSDERILTEITALDVVEEMHSLFEAAQLTPPYVFVGHSISGITDRLYRHEYKEDVAGLVLVEAGYEEHFEVFGRPESVEYQTTIDFSEAFNVLRSDRNLGDMPLVVLHGGAQKEDPFTTDVWLETHRDQAQLSTNSYLLQANTSAHFPHETQPDVVTAAIRAVVEAVRQGSDLAPCEDLVTDLDATCLTIE